MNDFHWDDSAVLLLIEQFHENEILWNPRNKDFKNRMKRNDALKIIASLFSIESSEIERKLKNISSHFFREHRKYEESKKSGSGRDDIQPPKWFAYRALSFLKDKNKPVSTVNSEDTLIVLDDSANSRQNGNKTTRKRDAEPDPEITEALQLLRDISSKKRDDVDVFAEFIACKLRKMDDYTKSSVQNQIQSLIFEAEMNMFSDTRREFNTVSSNIRSGYFTQQPVTSTPSTSQSYSTRVHEYIVQDSSDSNSNDESLQTLMELN